MKRIRLNEGRIPLSQVSGNFERFSEGDVITDVMNPRGELGEIEILKVELLPTYKGLDVMITYEYTNLDTKKRSTSTTTGDAFYRTYLQNR